MKKLLILFTLLGCSVLCCVAKIQIPYDRDFNPRSNEFTRHKLRCFYSDYWDYLDGARITESNYAEIYVTLSPNGEQRCIIGYGPSQKLKNLDRSSTERQILIIADNPYYGMLINEKEPYKSSVVNISSIAYEPYHIVEHGLVNFCLADNLTFDFDLSEYACNFDIYIFLFNTYLIFDNAFSNFNYSDNIKSLNIYFGTTFGNLATEIGHNAFASLNKIDKVDIRFHGYFNEGAKTHIDYSETPIIYSDSFAQETYDSTPLVTLADEEKINELMTNPTVHNYSNNFFRFFKNWISDVEDIAVDESPANYTIQGRTIVLTNLKPQQIVNIYTTSGANVGSFIADEFGVLNIDIEQPGFYLLKADSTCYKVVIH